MKSNDKIKLDTESAAFYLDQINFKDDDEIQKLTTFFSGNQKLNYIYFTQKQINTIDFQKALFLFKAMQSNNNIKLLCFDNCSIHELGKDNLIKLLQGIKISNIKALQIKRGSFQKPFLTVEFIGSLSTIAFKSLELSLMELGKLELNVLHNAIQKLGGMTLESLSLSSNLIGLEDLENEDDPYYFNLLSILFKGKYNHLDLSINPLGIRLSHSDWQEIFKIVGENQTLASLNLASCALHFVEEFQPEFIDLLCDFVKTTKLKRIDLSNNNFTKEGLEKLLQSAATNKQLIFECTQKVFSIKESADTPVIEDATSTSKTKSVLGGKPL